MSAWKAGDLALCIRSGDWVDTETFEVVPGPEKGEICMVTGYTFHGDHPVLFLKEWPDRDGWSAYAFRKIKPDTDPAEEEFSVFIKAMDRKPELV